MVIVGGFLSTVATKVIITFLARDNVPGPDVTHVTLNPLDLPVVYCAVFQLFAALGTVELKHLHCRLDAQRHRDLLLRRYHLLRGKRHAHLSSWVVGLVRWL